MKSDLRTILEAPLGGGLLIAALKPVKQRKTNKFLPFKNDVHVTMLLTLYKLIKSTKLPFLGKDPAVLT